MLPLVALLLAGAPDPSRLAGVRFSEAADVVRIRSAAWRPSDPRNGGRSVRLVAPGRMVLDWRTDGATCSFASRRHDGDTWALVVDCGGGAQPARWTWLSGGRVRTNVFAVAAPQMTDPAVELVRFDRDFAQVEQQYRADYRARAVQRLAGHWEDASGEVLIDLDERRATLSGRPAQVVAEPCLPLGGDPDAAHRICLSVIAEQTRVQLVEQGERLYECSWDESGEGARFDLSSGWRIFRRTN